MTTKRKSLFPVKEVNKMRVGSDPDIENSRKGILKAYDQQNIISNKSQSEKT